MRALLPSHGPELSATDLGEQYGWPSPPTSSPWSSWLRVNFAASVDGSVAAADGKSAGVSGTTDKLVFALLRATCDAVVVGAGTARTEKYGPVKVRESLRHLRAGDSGSTPAFDPPALVVVTRSARLDPQDPMFAGPTRTIVATCGAAGRPERAALAEVSEVVICGDTTVDLSALRRTLQDRGLRRLLCEGGPTLFADLIREGLVDELCLTISPLLVGGQIAMADGQVADPSRIASGRPLPTGSVPLTLAGAIEADGTLLLRYRPER